MVQGQKFMTTNSKIIMHLIATNFYGGPEKQITRHLNRLTGTYYKGVFASFLEYGKSNETIEKAKEFNIKNYGIPMMGPIDVCAQWKLNKLVRREKVNLLCVHGYKACVMGWWAGIKCGIPVIAFSRGYTDENKKIAFYNWLERRTLGRMSGVVFVSEGQKKKVASFGVKVRNNWVVKNAINVHSKQSFNQDETRKEVLSELGLSYDSKLIVTAGRLSPEKGHKYLIEAIKEMDGKQNNTCFVFCGEGQCREELEQLAKNLGVYKMCRFLGFRRDLQRFFKAMDLMVLPSLTEGLPNVVLEAFAWAKPVVATKVGGVPEVIQHGVNGFLVPPERPDLLANSICRYLDNPDMMKSMGETGWRIVKSDFNLESQTQKLETIYRKVLSSRIQ